MIDIACLIVFGATLYFVAQEGIQPATQSFVCTLLAALIAMNFFEPLAPILSGFMPDIYSDFVALVGLFIVLVFGLRMGCEQIAPSYIQVIPTVDSIGRWAIGAATGYLTMAFLLTALHTAPLQREFMGFKPERANFFGDAPDRRWLGFVQYISEKPFATYQRGGGKLMTPRIFDGRYEVVGDPAKPYTARDSMGRDEVQLIWPSFPIRYATRRERYALGSSAAPQAAPPPPPPPPASGKAPAPMGNPGF